MFRFSFVPFLCILVCCSTKPPAQEPASISPGKYIFSAPAIYSEKDGSVVQLLCELEKQAEGYRLQFLELDRRSFIEFTLSSGGQIRIEGGDLSRGYVGRKAKGVGRLIDESSAKGELTVVSGALGMLTVFRLKSEWYLRPATGKEIQDKMLEGLRRVENSLYRRGVEPTLENIEKELPTGAGSGYSFSDREKIMKMLKEGSLVFADHQFHLKTKVADVKVRPPPISPGAQIEEIPIEGIEDCKQDFFSDEIETLPKKSHRKP